MSRENPSQISQLSQFTDFMPVRSAAREALPAALQSGQTLRKALMLLAAGCGIGLLALLGFHADNDNVRSVAASVLMLGLVALASLRMPAHWLGTLFSLCAGAAVLVIAGAAYALGWGLMAPALLLMPLLVLGAAGAAPTRFGLAVAALAAGSVAWLWWQVPANGHGGLATAVPPPGQLLALHLLALGMAWGTGRLLRDSLLRQREVERQRESRFHELLALAADAYWEIDADYRLTAGVLHLEATVPLTAQTGLGVVPWRLPSFVCNSDTLDHLQACLDSRLPFRDQPVGWQAPDGSELSFLVSGEPRFGERGHFTGYWGVARDITADSDTRQTLLATENRYQELFSRIPTPLLMHRQGQIIEANPAALALFGVKGNSALYGQDLLSFYEAGDSRERARRRIEELDRLAVGAALPISEFRLRVGSRSAWVRATSVRVAAPGGPATLAIYIDESEHRQAEQQLRRNEALLQHLVATSPDLITLTEMATGRYVMVNQAFERRTGYTAEQSVGHTSLELGVWRSAEERENFVKQIQETGSVADLPVRFATRNGEDLSLLVSAARFVMDRREYLVVNARDVTERERDRLEREAILANASVGIAVTRNRCFVLANRHFEALYGWPDGSIIGQPGSAAWPSDADYAEVGSQVNEPLQRGESVELERLAKRRDGSTFLARMRGCPIDPTRPQDGGTIWIIEDVSSRREQELALARARDEAEAASRAKSAFLANTSHELRTPLNGILGLAHLARAPQLEPALRQQYLDQISDSAHTLADIISDILDLSKIEAGKLDLEQQAFDLGTLLHGLQRAWQAQAQARGLQLEVDVAADCTGSVWGDPTRLRQILNNYYSNALKFTSAGTVKLQVRRLPDGIVRLEVHDTGPGLTAEVQQRLFRPFTQADESITRRFGGTGLGLSICRELAELMGGRVGVHSQLGQGSCFWAELPLPEHVAEHVAEPVAQPLGAVGPPQPAGLPSRIQPPDVPQPRPGLRGRKLLIVEDNAVNMLIAVAMMEGWGLQVAQATDGLQALTMVQRAFDEGRPFDAVLMDVQMPQMSGHEVTRALRRTQPGAHLPIIALTAAALSSERSAALDAGMNDFLTKPVDAARLLASLERWVLPVVR